MADLFAPQNIMKYLAAGDPIQGPANQGAVQQLLRNPQLMRAIQLVTGGGQTPLQQIRPNNLIPMLQNGTAPISTALHPFEAAMQSVDPFVSKTGASNLLQQVGQAAKTLSDKSLPVVQSAQSMLPVAQGGAAPVAQVAQQATKAIPMGAQAGVNALPTMEQALHNAIAGRVGNMGQIADMGKNVLSAGEMAMGPGASKALLNPQAVNSAMSMMPNLGKSASVLTKQLPGLAQSAQASGRLLPAISGASLAGTALPAMASNPATWGALLAAALGIAAVGGGVYTGQKLGQAADQRLGRQQTAEVQGMNRPGFYQLLDAALQSRDAMQNNPGRALTTPGVTPTEDVTVLPDPTSATELLTDPNTQAPSGGGSMGNFVRQLSANAGVEQPAPQSAGVSEVLKSITPGAQQALDVASMLPSQGMDQSSGNTYGYESILNDPSFSAEAMLGPSTQAQAPKEESFLSKLGGVLKGAAPSIIEALVMQQLSKPRGGVRDGMTGLTFGASDPTQSLAYQKYVADINERSARRNAQYESMLGLRADLEKKYVDADIASQKAIQDFNIKTVQNMQTTAVDLLKNNKINWDALRASPDYDTIMSGLASGDPTSIQTVLEYSPDVKMQLEQQGYAVYKAIGQMTDPAERAKALEDSTVQGLMGVIGMGPDAEQMYIQAKNDQRELLRLETQAALTRLREGGAYARNANTVGASRNSQSIQQERLKFDQEKFKYEQEQDALDRLYGKATTNKTTSAKPAKDKKFTITGIGTLVIPVDPTTGQPAGNGTFTAQTGRGYMQKTAQPRTMTPAEAVGMGFFSPGGATVSDPAAEPGDDYVPLDRID